MVAAWAQGRAVAWLSLSPFDSEPTRLAAGIIEALQSAAVAHELSEAAELRTVELDPQDVGKTYRALCDALDALDEPIVLVVDDAQRAAESIDRSLLGALIERAPESLRLVLVGTTMLEIAVSRHLLMHADSLIDAVALAFDLDEISTLLVAGAGAVSPELVWEETQGWPIAARAMALGGARSSDQGSVSQATVMRDYVREHVLRRLPADLRQIVLETTITTELTPALAAAIADRSDAAVLLEGCARRGLFLDRFATPEGTVYRWHDYFARQCRAIVEIDDPERPAVLHRRAAAALADEDPIAAISHLLAAGAPDEAVDLIVRRWVRIVLGSEASALDQLCAVLPAPFGVDPRVLFIRACAQDLIGTHDAARLLFAQADAAAARDRQGTALVRALASLFLLDDRDAVAKAGEEVRALALDLGQSVGDDRAAVLYLLAWAHMRLRGEPRSIVDLLTAALREAEAIGDVELAGRTREHLALAFAWAGAMSRARQALSALGDRAENAEAPAQYFAGGSSALAAALVAYWGDDFAETRLQTDRVIRSGSGIVSYAGIARWVLALGAAASKDSRAGRLAAQELQALPRVEMHGWSWPAFRRAAFAALEEAAGHRDRAVALVRSLDASRLPHVAVVLAGILRRAGEPAEALRLLQSLKGYEEISYVRIATLATAAVVNRRRGAVELTHELCERALGLAASEGIRRPFCEGELELRQLLAEHIAWGTKHEDFIAACLTPRTRGGVLDELSERERDVFEQLRTSRTMAEIADELGVSINTVKTHQRAVYRKLGVASRREAVRLFT